MNYQVYIRRSAEKSLNRLERPIHSRISNKILYLERNPRPWGCRKLFKQQAYRIRVSEYRILYTVNDDKRTIEIFDIGHRREVYR